MYPVAIIGESLAAQIAALACGATGFHELTRYAGPAASGYRSPILSLGANASRLLRALAPDTIDALGFRPDRQQVRFAKSAYLLAELPLGEFYEQRYGAPLVNFSARSLNDRLENDIGNPLLTDKRLEEIEDANRLTVVSGPSPMQSPKEASYNVFEASLADHPLRRANVLWRGKGQYIEQLSDAERVHFRFVTPSNQDFNEADWHPSLHQALDAKTLAGGIDLGNLQAQETLFAGRVVYLSDALQTPLHCKVDGGNAAVEDAWVLSRMMDNYEEDIGDGLAAYERFRRPRHRKVLAQMRAHLIRLTEPSPARRFQQHVGTALQNRLLPEIALQQQDWLFEHDVIKGFR